MKKKSLTIVFIVLLLCGGLYWYANRAGWLVDSSPTRPPTADEIRRMEEIERSSSQIAPDAKAGAGVLPPGSVPVTPPPTTEVDEEVVEATSTEAADGEVEPLP